MRATKLYYASDLHGSNRCFRKFLNAAKFYQAQVLIMGGDILGKAIVFLEEVRPGVYTTTAHQREVALAGEDEGRALEKQVGDQGLYAYRCKKGAWQALDTSG